MATDQKNIYIIFLLVAVGAWCGLILLAPILANYNLPKFSGAIYLFFSKTCHQMPDRSFLLMGKSLAVCSRCTAIYFSFGIGAILFPLLYRFSKKSTISVKWLGWALIPLTIDFLVNFTGLVANSFFTRTITGALVGVTAGLIVAGIILGDHQNKSP